MAPRDDITYVTQNCLKAAMLLYDDLGVGASDTKTEGWSKNFKLLQSQLKVKKAALTQAKRQRTKQVLAPVIDLKRGGSSDERQITDTPPHAAAGLKDAMPSGFSANDVLILLADEYDPMFPNDYEKVLKQHREERQRQREQERQKEIEEREKKRKDRHDSGTPSGFSRFPAAEEDSDEEEEYEKERRKRSMGGAAIAPPSSLVDRDSKSPHHTGHRKRSKFKLEHGSRMGSHVPLSAKTLQILLPASY
ncbi:splicing factor 45-like [Pholidichthys leucotaenia]